MIKDSRQKESTQGESLNSGEKKANTENPWIRAKEGKKASHLEVLMELRQWII